ncbi:MAG: chromosome segregation protein SMC [Nitrospiraceae bacterium]|nr:chromosome segregation protein SMC [Nitrospiraceae bacterium]
MRVEKIELIGFKSFAEKTTFDLHKGITCIVGPNGCGKSNVVDSFKWVLGEQSAKSLRGDKMIEVVFDGSQSKKPKGMAEVSMTVSGLNGGSENGQALVTRRLYRSGESDYMINRSACRLKDIKNLFLDTGLELKSYAIFEQENISRIINSKPEERRFLIEEVAGVVKYKVRRAEAENKLESSRLNLQRLTDIISEVKRQINSLDRQAKKAERYKKIIEELKGLELRQARKNWVEQTGRLAELETEFFAALKEKDAALRGELSGVENEHTQRRIIIVDKEKALGVLQEELQGLERAIAEKEREMAVSDTEKEALKQNLIRLDHDEKELNARISSSQARVEELRAEREGLSNRISSCEDALREKNGALAASRQAIEEMEGEIEAARKELFRISEEVSSHAGEIGRAEQALSGLGRKEESLAAEIGSEEKALTERETSLAGLQASIKEKSEGSARLKGEKEALSAELQALKTSLEGLRGGIARGREALASALSRAESLREILLDPVTKELLGLEDLHIKKGLSDVMEAAPEYEKAIEAVLRGLAGGFIAQSREEALKALKTLRGKEIERAFFIPADLDSNGTPENMPEGVLGRAMDFIKAEPRYEGMVKALLKGAYIVRELDDVPRSANGYTFVSLSGEVLDARGTLSGGQNKELLAKKRQLRELEKEAGGLKARVASQEEESARVSAQITEKEQALKALEARSHELDREISLLGHSMESARGEIERIRKKTGYLRLEQENLKKEFLQLEALLAEKKDRQDASAARKTESERRIAGIQEELSGKKAAFEAERTALVDSRMELNSLRQKLENAGREAASLAALKEETLSRLQRIGVERQKTGESIRQKEENHEILFGALREIVRKSDAVKETAGRSRSELEGLSGGLLAFEERIKALRQEIDSLGHAIAETEVKITELRLTAENLRSNILATYEIDIAGHEAEPPAEGDTELIAELKKKIAELGPVSLATIEEYEELKTRFGFLTGQKEDLEKSIAELEEAIKKINTSTRKMLRDAYEALRDKFAEVFVDFFGGGRAELTLTDEQNILETGIDIIAQPPGKKLQNIHLLSGGEKSLTALSLLFASFLIKPTPICILDEADAALDESNTVKFAQMLKTLSSATQFVVITHNRITMEVADYIYGVTMQEPGVSSIISMRFAEA